MFPSLSDRTKTFIAVSAVLAVALCNVVFGMDWLAERPAVRPLAAVTGVTEPPMLASPPVQSRARCAGRGRQPAIERQHRRAGQGRAAPERRRSNECAGRTEDRRVATRHRDHNNE